MLALPVGLPHLGTPLFAPPRVEAEQPVEAVFPGLPFSSRPQALLSQRCSFHLKLPCFRTGFLEHQVHRALKGHDLPKPRP